MNKMVAVRCLWLLLAIWAHCKMAGGADDKSVEEVMVDDADLEVEFYIGNKMRIIEGIRSTKNDRILSNKQTESYGQLQWYSIGYPFLASPPNAFNRYEQTLSDQIEMTNDGVNVFVGMLDEKQKELLKQKVKSKYGVDVSPLQIHILMPSEVSCSINLEECEKNGQLKGKANNVREVPLKISFSAPVKSKERACFETMLIQNQHFEITCNIQKSKLTKIDTFSLKWSQIAQLDLVDRLFGPASAVYVSRQQLARLSHEIYTKMNVWEEYELEEDTFEGDFVKDLIMQTAEHAFQQISFDEGLSSLSKYNTSNLSPDTIRSEMSRMFEIKTAGDKKHIVLSKANSITGANQTMGHYHNETPLSGKGFGFDAAASCQNVQEKEASWQRSGKSLSDQLNELNWHTTKEVQWEMSGEKIVPKSLSLCKLVKSKFRKDLVFSRIKRVVPKVFFRRKAVLDYRGKPEETYTSLSETAVKDSINALTFLKFKSLADCFHACNKRSGCHFVDVDINERKCSLFNQEAFLSLQKSPSRRVFQRQKFSKEVVDKVQLTGHFKGPLNTYSEDSCWEECLRERHCVVASLDTENSECFLFKSREYSVTAKSSFITIFFQNENITNPRKELGAYRLAGHFKSVSAVRDMDSCWVQCFKEKECEVANFRESHSDCFLFKRGQFTIESDNDEEFVTMTFKTPRKTHKLSRFQDFKLRGHLHSVSADSEASCLQECFQMLGCVAFSFRQENSACNLVQKSLYQMVKEPGWVSVSFESKDGRGEIKIPIRYESTKLQGHFRSEAVASEESCWGRCANESECVTVSFSASGCLLFRRGEYLVERSQGWVSFSSRDDRLEGKFSLRHRNTFLEGHFLAVDMASETSCWNKCLKQERCVAISYNETDRCFLHRKGEFRAEERAGWITISLETEKNCQMHSKSYQNTKLLNHFKYLQKSSVYLCWEECSATEGCVAVSFKERHCFLFRESDFSVDRQSGWVSLVLAKVKIEKVYDQIRLLGNNQTVEASSASTCWAKCLQETDCVAICFKDRQCFLYQGNDLRAQKEENWATISIKNKTNKFPVDYPNTQIIGLFMAMNSSSEQACWNECLATSGCVAVSFGEGRCHLVKKGHYQTRRFDKWVSIYLDGEQPPSLPENASFSLKRTLVGHSENIHALAYLHDGYLASGSSDNTTKIWDPSDGSLKHTLSGHSFWVWALVVLHNGNLVSGSFDNTIKIWKDYKEERTLTGHSNYVLCLTVLPNTDFASASVDNTIRIWSASGDHKMTLTGHTNWVYSLAVLPNGDLASGSLDNSIKIWNSDGSVKKSLQGHSAYVYSLQVLKSGHLASGDGSGTIKIWSESGELLHSFSYHTDWMGPGGLAVLPNGDLVSSSADTTIKIKSQSALLGGSQEIKATLTGHTDTVFALVVLSHGDFASASFDDTIKIWSSQLFD